MTPSEAGTAQPARVTAPPHSALARLAGPLAISAGALMTVAQLVWLPFDPKDHQATALDPVFEAGSIAYFVAFCLLLLTLVAAYGWEEREAGTLGVVGVNAAIVGTMALGGDLWFEAFAVPWLAGAAPDALESAPSVLLALGALSSYALFSVGWVLFGIASLRARVFPAPISVAVVVGGVSGYNALLSPYGVPLGLAVAWLGVWMVRRRRVADDHGVDRS